MDQFGNYLIFTILWYVVFVIHFYESVIDTKFPANFEKENFFKERLEISNQLFFSNLVFKSHCSLRAY